MSTYSNCLRCKRDFSRPDSFSFVFSDDRAKDVQVQVLVSSDWCPYCNAHWPDLANGVDVLGSKSFQQGLLDDTSLLSELHTQQDIAAQWASKARHVWITGERWTC